MRNTVSIIEEIQNEYRRLDKICNVDTSNIEISISSRMTKQLGCFTFKDSGLSEKMSIRISSNIIDDHELFLDVIRHEYAHAIVHIRHPHRKHIHDDVWKAACIEVGCRPKATQKVDSISDEVKSRPDKYIVRCKNCNVESKYRSEGKVIKILLHKKRGKVICKKCGSNNFEIITLN